MTRDHDTPQKQQARIERVSRDLADAFARKDIAFAKALLSVQPAALRPAMTAAAKKVVETRADDKRRRTRALLWRGSKQALLAGLAAGVLIMEPPPVPYRDDPSDSDAVVELKTEFARTPLGREMLVFAKSNHIKIIEDPSMSTRGNLGEYGSSSKTAAFTRLITKEGKEYPVPMVDRVMVLAHELRHAWQDVQLGYPKMQERYLTADQRFALYHFIEADACAFSAYFQADRIHHIGRSKEKNTEQAAQAGLADTLLKSMDKNGALPPAVYYNSTLTACFKNISGYNGFHMRITMERSKSDAEIITSAAQLATSGDAKGSRKKTEAFKKFAATRPTSAEFNDWLRRFGGYSLNIAAPTALQTLKVDDATVLHALPKASISEKELPTFDEKFSIAQKRIELSETILPETEALLDNMEKPAAINPRLRH